MKRKSKETLVTDQPGRKVVFVGFILSLVLGFFIRGLTKPEFLQAELKGAVSRIHSSTQVNWGRAAFSLKDGFWPRFSILITDVKIVSEESCWGQPLLYAREVELPISFVSFIEHGQPLKTIYIKDSFLELRSHFVCAKKNEVAVNLTEEKVQGIRLKPVKETPEAPPLVLTDFIFQNLKVRQVDWIFPDWNFNTFELVVKENHPWYAEVSSNFNIPDLDGIDTGVDLFAVYKEFPAQVLEVKVNGHWREGAFQVSGLWEGAQKGWTYNSKFNHIPFQFLKTIAQRTRTPWNWPDRPMWFSFSTQTVQPFTDWKASQHFVKKLQVEGDLGELAIPDLEIKSWTPFKVLPFAFTVNQADLNAVFEKDLKRVDYLGSFGKLSGQGQWASEKDVLFTGKIEQIGIPIFHKDQKMVKLIRSMDLQAELKSGQWKMSSQKWELDRGDVSGNLKLESNQNISTGNLSMNLESLKLDSDTLRFIEVVTPNLELSAKLNARWKNSNIIDLNGQVKTDQLESRVIGLEKPLMTVRKTASGPLDLKLQAAELKIRDFSFGALDTAALAELQLPYEAKNMNAQFLWDMADNMKWTLTSSSIRSNGTLDPDGGLKGVLNLSTGAKAQERTLQLLGSRRSPQLLLLR